MKDQKAVLSHIEKLNERYSDSDALEILQGFIEEYEGYIALATSLSPEDQVLLQMVIDIDQKVKVFTLDTGRLFPETYDLIALTNSRYNCNIEVCFPNFVDVEEMVSKWGINLFYSSIENRKLCCRIRKVLPLKRALGKMKVWICGLRRAQSVTRTEMKPVEWDSFNGLIKINPLIGWTDDMLYEYIKNNNIPINALHKKGFTSIGCQPCTRAIEPGEDARAGRWWWETPETRECGLHK